MLEQECKNLCCRDKLPRRIGRHDAYLMRKARKGHPNLGRNRKEYFNVHKEAPGKRHKSRMGGLIRGHRIDYQLRGPIEKVSRGSIRVSEVQR